MSASATPDASTSPGQAFFLKHEFLIRRLHSLLGIVPLGLYMVVHLTTNASLLNGSETFQKAVYMIHTPGKLLPLIEWGAIFLPLIFHAVIGVWIAKTARLNSDKYSFTSNKRYTWQRYTGFIALVYLFCHILHLHGWAHFEWWQAILHKVGLGQFLPYRASSTLATAMQGYLWPAFYLVGMLACVYHLANGLWTAGITWGIWISAAAQQRASKVCVVLGLLLAVIGVSAWWAAVAPGEEEIAEFKKNEVRQYEAAREAGMIPDMPEKFGETSNESKSAESASVSTQSEFTTQ
jgi:succinate dehydrogenase / fumarate reductase, cytochrome b subunit